MPLPTPDKILCCHRRCSLAAIADHAVGERAAGSRQLSLQKRSGYSLLGATIAGLRTYAPCGFPVVVRTGGVPVTMDGFCIRRRSRFVIHLGDCLSPSNSVAVLIHEWAHARSWSHYLDRAARDVRAGTITEDEFDEISHGPAFGVEYAACWRVFSGIVLPTVSSGRL
jgi:hypothetical protein